MIEERLPIMGSEHNTVPLTLPCLHSQTSLQSSKKDISRKDLMIDGCLPIKAVSSEQVVFESSEPIPLPYTFSKTHLQSSLESEVTRNDLMIEGFLPIKDHSYNSTMTDFYDYYHNRFSQREPIPLPYPRLFSDTHSESSIESEKVLIIERFLPIEEDIVNNNCQLSELVPFPFPQFFYSHSKPSTKINRKDLMIEGFLPINESDQQSVHNQFESSNPIPLPYSSFPLSTKPKMDFVTRKDEMFAGRLPVEEESSRFFFRQNEKRAIPLP